MDYEFLRKLLAAFERRGVRYAINSSSVAAVGHQIGYPCGTSHA